MKIFKLSDMKKGWFVGDFLPSCLKTGEFEAACKYYKKGDIEKRHVHKIAIEITLIVEGLVRINGIIYNKGDIIMLDPGDAAGFEALEDATTIVVKTPSVTGDKYLV